MAKDTTVADVEAESKANDELAAKHAADYRERQMGVREPDDETASPSLMAPAPPADPAFVPRTGGTEFDRKLEAEQGDTVAEAVDKAERGDAPTDKSAE